MSSEPIPALGVVTRHDLGESFYKIHRGYPGSVAKSGCNPFILPLEVDAEHIRDVVRRMDGIVLTGNVGDVSPYRYGEEPHLEMGMMNPLRDQFVIDLIEQAVEVGRPIFGICSGLQYFNVFRGGTLYQDVNTQLKEPVRHDFDDPYVGPCHSIRIETGSFLSDCTDQQRVMVNSQHHQGVKDPGENLVVSARSPDGLVEAMQADDYPFIGVQWHPERDYEDNPMSRELFKTFRNMVMEHRRKPT